MKWILWMILFVCISLQATSVTDYFERPTQAQIEKYYQDKAATPWRYTCNPLQVGNRWYYNGENSGEPIPTHLGRSVTADSLINGIMYYYVTSSLTMESLYEYNQGDSVIGYVYDSYPTPHYTDELYYIFSPGAFYYPVWNGYTIVSCPEGQLLNLWGHTVMTYSFNGSGLILNTWAEMFGPISFSFDFGGVGCLGCIIDGVTYGTVPTSDEQLPVINNLTISAYPNPFRQSVSIQTKGKTNTINYAIYNLKGQLVRSWQDVRTDTITWDSRDASGNAVSPGIYFIKASDQSHTAVSKLLKIED